MNETQFRQLFEDMLETDVPTVHLEVRIHARHIQARLREPVKRRATSGFRPAKALIVALLLVLSAFAAYAVYQSVVIPSDEGIVKVEVANLLTYYDQTQSIEGQFGEYNLTVTLDFAYADANRITVGYTVRGESPDGRHVTAYSNPTLMTTDGTVIERSMLIGDRQDLVEATENHNGTFTSRLTTNFIANDLRPNEQNALDLRLVADVALTLGGGENGGMMMAGNTDFTFAVPFIEGQIIAVDQLMADRLFRMAFYDVIVTPSMIRLELCYTLPQPENQPDWQPFIILAIDGETVFSGAALAAPHDALSPCRAVFIPQALDSLGGEWQMVIEKFSPFTETDDGSGEVHGPWGFRFGIPKDAEG